MPHPLYMQVKVFTKLVFLIGNQKKHQSLGNIFKNIEVIY
jgi:hypothetical protein